MKKRSRHWRVFLCEGCGTDRAPYKCGRSTKPYREVPDGIARWCYECAQGFMPRPRLAGGSSLPLPEKPSE